MAKSKKTLVKKIVTQWARKNDVDLTDVGFYSPKEWRDRGESYCREASCIITAEGTLCGIWNGYYGTASYALLDSFYNMLQEHGLWYEMGTHWYVGIYEN